MGEIEIKNYYSNLVNDYEEEYMKVILLNTIDSIVKLGYTDDIEILKQIWITDNSLINKSKTLEELFINEFMIYGKPVTSYRGISFNRKDIINVIRHLEDKELLDFIILKDKLMGGLVPTSLDLNTAIKFCDKDYSVLLKC